MHARLSARRVWDAIELWLIPTLRLNTHERSLYYYLVHRTRIAGRRSLLLSRRRAAEVTGLSTGTARHYLCVLAEKQCIRFLDRGQRGSLIEVRLPQEIARSAGFQPAFSSASRRQRSSLDSRLVPPASSRRRRFPETETAQGRQGCRRYDLANRNAAGQPRAWPRNQPLRQRALRGVIFRRARGRCFYCLRPIRRAQWTLDHIVPVTRGGSDAPRNLVACCHQCNSTKNAMPAAAFLRLLARRGIIPAASLPGRLRRLQFLSMTLSRHE